MFDHKNIWNAIDQIAVQFGLSTSGLAKLSGLDSTSFNKSKRQGKDGKLRWPSTESISKVLCAVNLDFFDFAQMVTDAPLNIKAPLLRWEQASEENTFDNSGLPMGDLWSTLNIPGTAIYALEISGDSLQPVLNPGHHVLVAPSKAVQLGDRVIVKTIGGKLLAKKLKSMSETQVVFASLNPSEEDITMDTFEVLWMARIMWISQ